MGSWMERNQETSICKSTLLISRTSLRHSTTVEKLKVRRFASLVGVISTTFLNKENSLFREKELSKHESALKASTLSSLVSAL